MASNQIPNLGQDFTADKVRMDNFTAILSGKITTSGTSASFTFSPIYGTTKTTFKITNKGTKGAYLGWGKGSATAVASSGTGNGVANADYIGAGAILTQDFINASGVAAVDTIAAIQGSDTEDNGSTILEISMGVGQ